MQKHIMKVLLVVALLMYFLQFCCCFAIDLLRWKLKCLYGIFKQKTFVPSNLF